jgi:mRNA interferase MazF
MARYIPRKGDFISITFDPQSGHLQEGRRPLTTTDRQIPFHLAVPSGLKLSGFVMVEQVKSIDYTARQAKFIQRAPSDLIDDALAILDACLK